MADNLGPNGLVVSFILHLDPNDFLHEVQFSVAIEATIFRIERRAIEAHVSNPFSPYLKL